MTARGASAEARLKRKRFGADFWGSQVVAAFAASERWTAIDAAAACSNSLTMKQPQKPRSPRRNKDDRAKETDEAAAMTIALQKTARDEKTARLRALRLEQAKK